MESSSDSLKSKYDQTARERDEAQRAYTHARQEVDALLHSLQHMKAERDQAVANYQNVVSAPAAGTARVIGSVSSHMYSLYRVQRESK